MKTTLLLLLAFAAGAMIPVQTGVNTALGKSLASPFLSTLAVFVVGTLAMAVCLLATRAELPTGQMIAGAPYWSWVGGILGATYIVLLIYLTPKLGVGTVTALVVAGQIATAVLIDHFGLLGSPVHSVSVGRVAGAALLIAGVILIRRF